MLARWLGEIVGEMHIAGITSKQLAAEVGWHEKYLSAVLNGHRSPKNAEKTLREALGRLLEKKKHEERKKDNDLRTAGTHLFKRVHIYRRVHGTNRRN